MKNLIFILFLCTSFILYSQSKKSEDAYLIFDNTSSKKCLIESGDGTTRQTNFFRKVLEEKRILFYLCDEAFYFSTENKVDTITSVDSLFIKRLPDLKKDYNKSSSFKHHVYDNLYILEKVSPNSFLKYKVYWCCEWVID